MHDCHGAKTSDHLSCSDSRCPDAATAALAGTCEQMHRSASCLPCHGLDAVPHFDRGLQLDQREVCCVESLGIAARGEHRGHRSVGRHTGCDGFAELVQLAQLHRASCGSGWCEHLQTMRRQASALQAARGGCIRSIDFGCVKLVQRAAGPRRLRSHLKICTRLPMPKQSWASRHAVQDMRG